MYCISLQGPIVNPYVHINSRELVGAHWSFLVLFVGVELVAAMPPVDGVQLLFAE